MMRRADETVGATTSRPGGGRHRAQVDDLDLDELWMAYACGGGQLLIDDLRAALDGDRPVSDLERGILATAIDHCLLTAGSDPWTDRADDQCDDAGVGRAR
jgi:hypothetical protein